MKRFVLVSGDLTTHGGMDRANYELAWHLAERAGAQVHIVAFHVESPLAEHPNVVWHRVAKPLNSYTMAEGILRRTGKRIARSLPDARTIVNGGNCDWPDVNWVHALHAAWDCRHEHAPLRFRARARFTKWRARVNEQTALRKARLVITNSERTRRQAIDLLGLDETRVHRVHYGIDADVFRPATLQQRAAARAALNLPADKPVVAFIGTLGWDRNKGFDTLFRAQQFLCSDASWDTVLIAAGAGAEGEFWRAEAKRIGLEQRIRMLGFTTQIPDLLAASDLLVAPSTYESYGLAVHEALSREIPVMVSATAGIAGRYPADLRKLLLENPTDVSDLADKLKRWRENPRRFSEALARFSRQLRETSWEEMSSQILRLIKDCDMHREPRRRAGFSLDASTGDAIHMQPEACTPMTEQRT
jgi:glycosyltransferase involved in cell wall biosynthesis